MFTSLHAGALRIALPLNDLLSLARGAGFAALELPMDEALRLAEATSAEEVKGRFAAAGVRPGSWGLPVNFRGDQATFERELAELPRYAALAQALGSPWCTTWILPFSDTLDFAANMDVHVERLRPVSRILADHGCRFGLEFVGPKTMRAGHTYEFISTIDGALDLARRLGTGNVGLLLDSFHWYTAHGTPDDLARLRASEVVCVHVNDAVAGRGVDEQLDQERELPGASGLIDIAAFLGALQRMCYDGPVAVEPFNAAITALPPADRARAAARSLQTAYAQAGLQ
jgi:sugar phosphate isomerase/epimerase